MNGRGNETQTVDRIGLLSFTFWINKARGKTVTPFAQQIHSQPAKLLLVSLLIMGLLCGWVYYGNS
jgi:hypothetical protein